VRHVRDEESMKPQNGSKFAGMALQSEKRDCGAPGVTYK
jgi:hypothetical protein